MTNIKQECLKGQMLIVNKSVNENVIDRQTDHQGATQILQQHLLNWNCSKKSLLQAFCGEKEKLLILSNFSFPNNDFKSGLLHMFIEDVSVWIKVNRLKII